MDRTKLDLVKERTWFYRFELPDGTTTPSDLPEAMAEIHTTRARHLRRIVESYVENPASLSAIDFASHEGFYSLQLAKYFAVVRGYEIRRESLAAARLITDVIGANNVQYVEADLQRMAFDPASAADFVLVFGLLYHMQDPIHVLRLASQLSRRHILIETQVFPFDVSGPIEDGYYRNQREVTGVFALTPDYPAHREGGSTELALVPSLNAVLFLMRTFGFAETEVLAPEPGDYEQYVRGSRVMIYGRKPSGLG